MLTWKDRRFYLFSGLIDVRDLLRENGWTWMIKERMKGKYIYMFLILGSKEDYVINLLSKEDHIIL
jgi:hypothetical protein